ncbi:MAG: D-alanyl-D-alanine carboxypeptidase [Clostridia bacterium]|jgi:D-alanyl-D-alanine carboxypeptidase (penicillin-binding protein 5/6)|nr:D-alanyl-D-alanine carboxypeptidase [Clostridia bacterium]
MKRISFALIFIILFMFPAKIVQATSKNILNINNEISYILIDGKTGQVLAENNADKIIRPASTTKILTAIVALEEGDLKDKMIVSLEAVNDIGDGGMNIGIMAGESNFTLEHMINVMMVKSANETANIIAENVYPTREAFIDRMNQRAKELGAENTTFYNVSGMDDKEEYKKHLTTARDMVMLARHAMTIPKFREIVKQEYYNDLPATNKHTEWPPLRTSNKLLWDTNQYKYTKNSEEHKYTITGIKTGYTSGAGFNLISSAVNEEGSELIAAVMNVKENNNAVYQYTKALYEYGFENYSVQNIVKQNEIIDSVAVAKSKYGDKVELVAAEDLDAIMPIEQNSWNIDTVQKISPNITAPIKQGQVLGTVEYRQNGVSIGKVDLIAAKAMEAKAKFNLSEGSKGFLGKGLFGWIIKILLLLYLILLARRHIKRSIRRKKRRKYMESRFKLK